MDSHCNAHYCGLSEKSRAYSEANELYEWFSAAEDTPQRIVHQLRSIVRGQTVLDICCGNGKYATLLARESKKYYGIDRHIEQLHRARRKTLQLTNAQLLCCNAEQLCLKDESVDLAISTWGIGSIDGADRKAMSLREAERVVKDAGSVILVENSSDGEFQDIRGGMYSRKAVAYNNWLAGQNYVLTAQISTNFSFASIDAAKSVFLDLWGTDVAERIPSSTIQHNVNIFEKVVHHG